MKLLEQLEKYKLAFIETHKIVQIIITIPIPKVLGVKERFLV